MVPKHQLILIALGLASPGSSSVGIPGISRGGKMRLIGGHKQGFSGFLASVAFRKAVFQMADGVISRFFEHDSDCTGNQAALEFMMQL